MSLIEKEIPKNNYELVRDKIGAILYDELEVQFLTYNVQEANVTEVSIERTSPEDHIELATVNVSIAENSFENKHPGQSDGSVIYNIDVYVKQKSEPGKSGDQHSQYKLQRLLGIIRYILEDPQYKTLAYTIPFIKHTMVNRIELRAPSANDTANCAMGRLSFQVDMVEETSLLEGVWLESHITQVKLGISDKGYKYVYGNEYGPPPPADNRYAKVVDEYGNVIAILNGGDVYVISGLTQYDILSSWNDPNNYIGKAVVGTLQTDPLWFVTRITTNLDGTLTTATASGIKWTDRLTATYT